MALTAQSHSDHPKNPIVWSPSTIWGLSGHHIQCLTSKHGILFIVTTQILHRRTSWSRIWNEPNHNHQQVAINSVLCRLKFPSWYSTWSPGDQDEVCVGFRGTAGLSLPVVSDSVRHCFRHQQTGRHDQHDNLTFLFIPPFGRLPGYHSEHSFLLKKFYYRHSPAFDKSWHCIIASWSIAQALRASPSHIDHT